MNINSDVNQYCVPPPFDIDLLRFPPLLPQEELYNHLRCQALSGPPTQLECALAESALTNIARLLQDVSLTKDTCDAESLIRHRRDRLWHEELFRRGAPELVSAALAAVEPVGLDRLSEVHSSCAPLLFVSLHQYLYSSILPAWVVCMAARHLGYPTAILLNSVSAPARASISTRVQELLASHVGDWMNHPTQGSHKKANVIAIDAKDPVIAVRSLLRHLKNCHAAFMLPDTLLTAEQDQRGRAIPFCVGNDTVYIPAGLAWLTQKTGCTVVPVHMFAWGNRHRVVFGQPVKSNTEKETLCGVFRDLIEQTLLARPTAYDGWELWGQSNNLGTGATVLSLSPK